MAFNAIPQVSGQIPEKSTTMWTQPRTQEQREYFSKHAAKRRVYGLIMTLLQGLHGVLALAAWTSIIGWAISAFVSAPWLIVVLAGTALLVFHLLFRVTWSTYWYDRMDNDTATDSSIFIPLAIMALLLYSESHGARKFLEAKVKPVEETAIVKADESFTPALNTVDASETRAKQAVRDAYKEKIAAVEQPYNANIAAWKRKKAATPEERKYINSNIRAFETSREAATAKYRNALSDSLLAITSRYAAQRQQLEGYVASKRTEIVQGNTSETSRYQSEMEQAGSYAWLISVVLLGLIAALGYAQVRINVKSGILPLRNYTVLDAHGSAVERIYTALADAMNRRWLQFAVWLHRWLSPKEVLTSFDGTVVTRPGEYNTPEGFFGGPKGKTQEQAEREVLEKLARHPGVKLNADQFADEVRHSLASNGHYKDEPLRNGPSPTSETARKRAAVTAGFEEELPNTVSQPPQPVSQPNDERVSVGAAEALLNIRTVLMRETNNLERENGVVASILKRMEAALWKAIELHNTPNFMPGVAVYQLFGDYIFQEFAPKMQALQAKASDEDQAHYEFIRNSRIEKLQEIMTTKGAKSQIVVEE